MRRWRYPANLCATASSEAESRLTSADSRIVSCSQIALEQAFSSGNSVLIQVGGDRQPNTLPKMNRKQPRHLIAFEIGTSGIGEHNSVSSGSDNGANNNLACGFWQSARHATTEQAVNNFLQRLGAFTTEGDDLKATGSGALNLCGHGNEGFLTTGCGQHDQQDYRTNYMATWNRAFWGVHMQRLSGANFPWLRIWSCHSGAGEAGADFLFEVAKTIGKPVMGNTGFLYSNSQCKIWMENGAVWQVATPTDRPKAIDPPSGHLTQSRPSMQKTLIIGEVELSVADIRAASLEFFSHHNHPRTESMADALILGPLIEELANSPQFELPGAPAAFRTCKLVLLSETGQLTLEIFNDRLIVDASSGTALYVGPMLSSLLVGLRGTR